MVSIDVPSIYVESMFRFLRYSVITGLVLTPPLSYHDQLYKISSISFPITSFDLLPVVSTRYPAQKTLICWTLFTFPQLHAQVCCLRKIESARTKKKKLTTYTLVKKATDEYGEIFSSNFGLKIFTDQS